MLAYAAGALHDIELHMDPSTDEIGCALDSILGVSFNSIDSIEIYRLVS